MKKYQLMAPGPTPVPSEVLLAMAQPIIHHRTPEYEALFIEVRAGLKTPGADRARTSSRSRAPARAPWKRRSSTRSRPATRSWSSAPASSASAGSTSRRAYGINVVEAEAPFGETVSPERVAEALKHHPGIKAVLVQHSETSTGVLHDVRGYAAVTRGTDAILVVDAVSSLGIADLPMDAWGVDVVVAGSQKGLMLPPGLGFCALSEKAWVKNKTAKLPQLLPRSRGGAQDARQERGALHPGRLHRRRPARRSPDARGARGSPTSSSATIAWRGPRGPAWKRSA